MRGGVTAAAVVAAHFGSGHAVGAKQRVGERGFAGTGRTHQHRAVARLQVLRQQRDAGRILAIERMDRRAVRQARAQRVDLLGASSRVSSLLSSTTGCAPESSVSDR
jgi:hypothetical protein